MSVNSQGAVREPLGMAFRKRSQNLEKGNILSLFLDNHVPSFKGKNISVL